MGRPPARSRARARPRVSSSPPRPPGRRYAFFRRVFFPVLSGFRPKSASSSALAYALRTKRSSAPWKRRFSSDVVRSRRRAARRADSACSTLAMESSSSSRIADELRRSVVDAPDGEQRGRAEAGGHPCGLRAEGDGARGAGALVHGGSDAIAGLLTRQAGVHRAMHERRSGAEGGERGRRACTGGRMGARAVRRTANAVRRPRRAVRWAARAVTPAEDALGSACID